MGGVLLDAVGHRLAGPEGGAADEEVHLGRVLREVHRPRGRAVRGPGEPVHFSGRSLIFRWPSTISPGRFTDTFHSHAP